jgi:hypothetical protein
MAAIFLPAYSTDVKLVAAVIDTDTTTAATGFKVESRYKKIIMLTTVSSRDDGTFTPQIDGSFDGVTWVNLKQGTAITSNTSNFTQYEGVIPPYLRISVLSASTTDGATVAADFRLED